MGRVSITLNGKTIQAHTSQTILEAASSQGIFIPSLCHDLRLEPYGSCRVCLVKVEGEKSYMPACSTQLKDGMVIDTDSPEVIEARRMSLVLLASDHFGDCDAPCSRECPAGIDIQGYIALVNAGKYTEAVKLIKEKNPLPLVIGRICPHPCETACRRNRVDEPVAINNLKRYAADRDISSECPYLPEKEPDRGKKIAVVGSGPAGLSAAYYLAQKGYQVTIFEKHPKPGGMLRYGIPCYRLPREILEKEISLVQKLGVKISCGMELGKHFNIEDLKKQGFSAVFLGLGAQKSTPMRIQGEDLEQVIGGIDFLYQVEAGQAPALSGNKVVVTGGGNTAMDAARTCLRFGASEVTVLYRRTQKEMPAHSFEVEEAKQEGVNFRFLASPVRIEEKDGCVAVECTKMELGEPDASGRRRPVPVQGSNYVITADYMITAIGQRTESSFLQNPSLVTSKDNINADPETGATQDPLVFSAGDCVTGARTAIEAIAGARKAALFIHQYLQTGMPPEKPATDHEQFNSSRGTLEQIPDSYFSVFKKASRVEMPAMQPGERRSSFEEIEKGLSKEQAESESRRCLECGCVENRSCKLRELCSLYNVEPNEFEGEMNIHAVKDYSNRKLPYIMKDENKCIKCGICVRICDEVWGLRIHGFAQRGFATRVGPYFDLELNQTACDFCGQCAQACPTGALSIRPTLPKPVDLETKKIEEMCINCPLGCRIDYHVYGDRWIKNTSTPGKGENDGNLCVRGRFGFLHLLPENRCFEHMEIKNGRTITLQPEQSIQKAVQVLAGSDRTAIITSAHLSNQEYELIYQMAQHLEGGDVFTIPYDFAEHPQQTYPIIHNPGPRLSSSGEHSGGVDLAYPAQASGSKQTELNSPGLGDIEKGSTLVLFNIYPGRSFPILEMKIRKAVNRGAELYIVNEKPTRLDDCAQEVFRISKKLHRGFINFVGAAIAYNAGYEAAGFFSEVNPSNIMDYLENAEVNHTIFSGAMIKPAKLKALVRCILEDKKAIFITDRNITAPDGLEAFYRCAYAANSTPSIVALYRGANPGGAKKLLQKTSGKNPSGHFLTRTMLEQYNSLVVYKLPQIFDFNSHTIIHMGFRPFQRYGTYGLFIPCSSLLETGGSIYNYRAEEVEVKPVLPAKPGLDNINTLNTIIRMLK
ncbi:MAG: FAD-dependent oxidoreductase [Spirochaetota bacterium]